MRSLYHRLTLLVSEAFLALQERVGPVDERGGGRNSDEGFHIGAGAVLGGAIALGVGAYIAKKIGALE
ncbi:hypothetical protein GCM10010472_01370 [Pseudonocardia halophobica]|jgi:hypothetical protein|uniref:Uncharacterized protein n=1 Tax=Pseudonocardia halophobica TaxID=29401 RepID=A0A9W6L042_9PSEU|nr:hypothetical protein [Pseudonocardia halophobica]GLL10477.1 hypothetical protein GCM10017577_16170 [Pseudonocardia halophobica]